MIITPETPASAQGVLATDKDVAATAKRANYQLLPEYAPEAYAALKTDIGEHGVRDPLVYDEDGNLLDGNHRLRAVEELQAEGVPVPDPPRIVQRGLRDEAEKRAFVRKVNLLRRHLNQEQKREVIGDQLRETPGRSDRRIAELLGVDGKTVASLRRELERRAEIPHVSTIRDTKGRQQPRRRQRVPRDVSAMRALATTPAGTRRPKISDVPAQAPRRGPSALLDTLAAEWAQRFSVDELEAIWYEVGLRLDPPQQAGYVEALCRIAKLLGSRGPRGANAHAVADKLIGEAVPPANIRCVECEDAAYLGDAIGTDQHEYHCFGNARHRAVLTSCAAESQSDLLSH